MEQKTKELRQLLQTYAENNLAMKNVYEQTEELLNSIISEQQKIYEEKKAKQKEAEMIENGEFPENIAEERKSKERKKA